MIGKIFQEDAYDGDEGGGEVSVIACGTAVRLSVAYGMEDNPASVTPATADAIASALHVAAAQVRAARGEAVEWKHVEGEQRWAGDMACVMGPTFAETGDDFVLIARADVPRLIAELGAWLAAHPAEAK